MSSRVKRITTDDGVTHIFCASKKKKVDNKQPIGGTNNPYKKFYPLRRRSFNVPTEIVDSSQTNSNSAMENIKSQKEEVKNIVNNGLLQKVTTNKIATKKPQQRMAKAVKSNVESNIANESSTSNSQPVYTSFSNTSTARNMSKSKQSKPTKPKRCLAKTVIKRLGKLGLNADRVSSCVKSAMSKGHIVLTGEPTDLEQLIIEGDFYDHSFQVYLKDVLYQPDYAGMDYEDGMENATATCICCIDEQYPGRVYVTGICNGTPEFDSGKYHNHCTQCKGFGKCIGDYREAHCPKCNKHWFSGLSGFACTNCETKKTRQPVLNISQMLMFGALLGAFAGNSESDQDD